MKTRPILPLFLLLALHLFFRAEGKVLTQCEAVKALQARGISRTLISNWVCLMQNESGMNTQLIKGPKTMSSFSFGVFQISSAKWCSRGHKGGVCNKRCEDFADDNIVDDIDCAKIIQNTDGFKAWDGWVKKCKNRPLPNIGQCLS